MKRSDSGASAGRPAKLGRRREHIRVRQARLRRDVTRPDPEVTTWVAAGRRGRAALSTAPRQSANTSRYKYFV